MTRTSRSCGWLLGLALTWAAGQATALEPERFSLAFEAGYQGLNSASDSAKAVFDGSTGGTTLGGSLRVGLGRLFFVGAGARFFSKEGQRVYVADAGSPVYPLGHPLELKLRPIYGFAGVRMFPESRLVPYLAVGGGATSYQETSTVGGVTEEVSESKGTFLVMLGADWRLGGGFSLGVEGRYTSISDAIGLAGVSKVYGEDNLGGFSFAGRLGFGR
jgi:opacity protein-like surface antigen